MKKYEITFVVSENYTEDKAADIAKDIKKMIESFGGRVEKEVFWGKRKLVYKIAKNTFGYYYVFIFDIEPEKANKLNKELNLSEKILRYLVVDFIEGSPFFEEGAPDNRSKKPTETKEEYTEEKRPRKFIKKKEVEEPKKQENIETINQEKAAEERIETEEAPTKEEITEEAPVGAENVLPEQEKVEESKKESAQAGHAPVVEKSEAEPAKEEEEVEERKPARKQMTEEERKDQLEKKLAELLKDEEI